MRVLVLLTALIPAASWAGYTTVRGWKPGSPALDNGCVYRFDADTAVTNTLAMGSPMTLGAGVTSVVWIAKGATVSLRGGNGSGITPGAPGICLADPSAVLIIAGHGTLVADGGNGGDGSKGGDGESARGDGEDIACGNGGNGGAGGGAGAVGIGGPSGQGGAEREGPRTSIGEADGETAWENNSWSGNMDGRDGNPGASGGDNGTIYIMGNVTVRAGHGTGGKTVGGGGTGGSGGKHDIAKDDYFAGPGAGGGGGAAGPEPTVDIGGGFGGAGGGGTGATGSTVVTDDYCDGDMYKNYPVTAWELTGYGGKGGQSDTESRVGQNGGMGSTSGWTLRYFNSYTITKNGDDKKGYPTRSPHPGGAGGLKGNNGKDGSILRMPNTTLTAEIPQASLKVLNEETLRSSDFAAVPQGLVYRLYLRISTTEQESYKVLLGGKYPQVSVPYREHYRFLGYYDQPNGKGNCYYDAMCRLQRTDDDEYWDSFEDLTLYAAWELDTEPSATIEVKAGQSLVIDELSGAESYFQPSCDTLIRVRHGGRLELRNLTFFGNPVADIGLISNGGELVVSNCSFRSCTAAKGRGGVYRDRPGAKARFIRCTFENCGGVEGGVIASEGSEVSVQCSTFLGNGAHNIMKDHAAGAAIFGDDSAKIAVVSCTFVDHVAYAEDKTGAVIALYDTNKTASASCWIVNCAIRLGDGCTNLCAGVADWSALNKEANLLSGDSSGSGSEVATKSSDATLTRAKDRPVCGVVHTTYKVFGSFRQQGVSHLIVERDAWPYFAEVASTEDPLYDQLFAHPNDNICGARSGNQLQYLIDKTPVGGTCLVPNGSYDGVVVNKAILIVGESPDGTVIDGEDEDACVTFETGGENAVWKNFTFQCGKSATGDGGAWTSHCSGLAGTASNCVFTASSAENGGAVARAMKIVDSVFTKCTAAVNGGATVGCGLVDRCYYRLNTCGNIGGGSAQDAVVRGSLFLQNGAESGGAVAKSACTLCTFARNTASTEAYSGAYAASLVGCVFYANPVPSGDGSNVSFSKQLPGGQFVNADQHDYHLAIRDRYNETTRLMHADVAITSPTIIKEAKREHWRDFDGVEFVSSNPLTGDQYLFAGCYSFAPFKTSGLKVNGTADWYLNSNTKSSLREAIQTAADYAPRTNGELRVTFDEWLFASSDYVRFEFGEAQVDLKAFTNVTLVVQGPSNHVAVLDGNGSFRAFRVHPNNRVRFENIYFHDFFGSPYGASPQPGLDGGAVLNEGTAMFSNCVFYANRAGNRNGTLPNDDPPVGFGGAIATEAGATSTVYAATFGGNRAAKGGAIWTADGGATRVYYSTFSGNVAGGDGVTDAAGGACAVERKTSGAMGSQLWLVNCTLSGNRVKSAADAGGAVSGARDGLVLLNSVVVGNYSADATNDVVVPFGSTSHFYYTAYGTRTPPPKTSVLSQQITYVDLCATGGVAYLDAIGLTNGMPVSKIAMPQTVLPLADTFAVAGTNVWTTADFATLGYGGTERSSVSVLAGGSRYRLLKSGVMRTVNLLGESQRTNGVVMLGPTTVTGTSLRGGSDEPGGETPTFDDEDAVDEAYAICYLVKIDGTTNYYATVETALKHWQPGDYATVCSEEDEALCEKFFDAFDAKLTDYVEKHPWFDYVWRDADILKMELTLNPDKATPVCCGELDMRSTAGMISVQIENTKPELWYSLGHATTPVGPYVCEKWVQADDSGTLKDFLTAPKVGDSGFYRVFVVPYVRQGQRGLMSLENP